MKPLKAKEGFKKTTFDMQRQISQKSKLPYAKLSVEEMATIAYDLIQWYKDDVQKTDSSNLEFWARAQAELLGFFISIWVFQLTGKSCCTCDVLEFLELDGPGVRRAKKQLEIKLKELLRT
jgi:hypothetical protein